MRIVYTRVMQSSTTTEHKMTKQEATKKLEHISFIVKALELKVIKPSELTELYEMTKDDLINLIVKLKMNQ